MEQVYLPLWPSLQRVPAVDAGNRTQVLALIGTDQYETKAMKRATNEMQKRELGPILSHFATIRQAYLDGHEFALILEDDVMPLLMCVVLLPAKESIAILTPNTRPRRNPHSLLLSQALLDQVHPCARAGGRPTLRWQARVDCAPAGVDVGARRRHLQGLYSHAGAAVVPSLVPMGDASLHGLQAWDGSLN